MLVAVVWPNHVHHPSAGAWFARQLDRAWHTCPITEAGFVRLSSNSRTTDGAVTPEAARRLLARLRSSGRHAFLANAVSMVDDEIPPMKGHRQVTDALLLGVARRHGLPLVTFDAGLAAMAGPGEVELLQA